MAATDLQLATAPKFCKSEVLNLKKHPNYSETWLEETICCEPSILRLGDIKIMERQRRQKDGIARVDLIAQSEDKTEIFVIEMMLGPLDSSHIVRSVEYWLREQKRFARKPEVEVKAVLIAEQICDSRFKDVVRFLCDRMPLTVKEVAAIQVGDMLTLHCTTILDSSDEQSEDITVQPPQTSLESWEHEHPATLQGAKWFLQHLQFLDPAAVLNFARSTISIRLGSTGNLCMRFRPSAHGSFRARAWISDAEIWRDRLRAQGLRLSGSEDAEDWVRMILTPEDISRHESTLNELCAACIEHQREE